MKITVSTGETIQVNFGPNEKLIVNAEFPLDNMHYITFENLLDREVVLVAQEGSTAWRVDSDMRIPAGQGGNNPFPSYNPGTYVWKMSDPNGAALRISGKMPDSKEAQPVAGAPVPAPYPYDDAPKFLTDKELKAGNLGLQPAGMPLHACMGLNSCKGSDRYGVSGPPDGEPNACAGHGYCSTTADHQCHVQNDCRNQGGCGLYGTAEEMNQPGENACRSMGSCATPINAERFSTNGPNQGKSVWARAREVFETQVWPQLREELLFKQSVGDVGKNQPLPEKLGPVPELFEGTGPTYLWVSDDNHERSNMTACGNSGMSGAGGCT